MHHVAKVTETIEKYYKEELNLDSVDENPEKFENENTGKTILSAPIIVNNHTEVTPQENNTDV